jgi:hypothetical protein
MLLLLINVLIIVVVGAIAFYLIDRFVRDARLGNLLKILVALEHNPIGLNRKLVSRDSQNRMDGRVSWD